VSDVVLSFDDIAAAHDRIRAEAHRTPVLTSTTADGRVGGRLFFKCENFQRMGAFKFRGAYNAIAQFTPAQRVGGVVAFSSGNHAQGIALSARILGVKALILMPTDAPAIKVAATRGYGAEVVLYDRYSEDRDAIGQRLADERGLTLISPYDHPHVMAGQGTVAKELIEEVGPLDVLITPLGGGGLLSGCATAAKAMSPGCSVIGVEPEAGNDGQQSFRSGKITFPVIQQRVDDILTVSDAELASAMKFFAIRMKMIVEPTGCLGAAAAFGGQLDLRGKRVGIVLTGGNVDMARFASLIADVA